MDSTDLEQITQETFFLCQKMDHVDPFSYPTKPGLIYRIEVTGGLFAIKGFATESISEVFEDITSSQGLLKNAIKYFETPDFGSAGVLQKNIFNRRFPLYEELVGETWQLAVEDGAITIYFYNRSDSLINLGPLGDKKWLPTLFETLEDVKVESGKLQCKLTFSNPELEFETRQALIEGRPSSQLKPLEQLSLLRSFWLEVEKQLFNKNGMLH